MNTETNKSPGQLAYEFYKDSLDSFHKVWELATWPQLPRFQRDTWEQTAAFMAGKTTQPAPEDLTHDRCPTCGSGDKRMHLVQPGGLQCSSAWHTDATAPEPWRPKFKRGDRVKIKNPLHYREDEVKTICDIIEDRRRYGVGDGCGTTWPEDALEPYIWTMPTPPAGHSWHRNDFTKAMLPPGYRPLCKGELPKKGDEVRIEGSLRLVWSIISEDRKMDGTSIHMLGFFYRTTRPAPSPAQDEPTAQTAAITAPFTPLTDQAQAECAELGGDFQVWYGYMSEHARRLETQLAFAQSSRTQTAVTAEEAYEHHVASRVEKSCFYDWPELSKDGKSAWEKTVEFITQRVLTQSSRMEQAKRNVEQASEDGIMLGSLLARIHRDGGHYEGQHGRKKAVEDADRIVAELHAMKDEMKQASGELPSVDHLCIDYKAACGKGADPTGINRVRDVIIERIPSARMAEEARTKAVVLSEDNRILEQRAESAEQTIADLRREVEELQRKIESLTIEKDGFAKGSAFALKKLTEESERAKHLESDLTATREALGKMEVLAYETRPELDNGKGVLWSKLYNDVQGIRYKLQDERDAARESLRKVEEERDAFKAQLETSRFNARHFQQMITDALTTAGAPTHHPDIGAPTRKPMMPQERIASLKASSGWVALSERRPTREDGTPDEYRLVLFTNGTYRALAHHDCVMNCGPASDYDADHIAFLPTHWMPIPPALPTPPPSPEEIEMVPLEASDVPPGSVFQERDRADVPEPAEGFHVPVCLFDRGIVFISKYSTCFSLSWNELHERGWFVKRPGQDWQPCSKAARKTKGERS